MKHFLFSLGFVAGSAAPLHANWVNTEWEMNEYKSSYECVPCIGERKEYLENHKLTLKKMQSFVSPELKEISEWMSALNFKQALIPLDKPGRYYVLASKDRSPEAEEVLGSRYASFKSYDGIQLSYDAFMAPFLKKGGYTKVDMINNSTTLAHEVYHGVQAAHRPKDEEKTKTWFSESIPEAVGRAWAVEKYGALEFNTPDYHRSLHVPKDEFHRDHFFYYLGEILGAEPSISYLVELEEESGRDGHNGLIWLDSFLKSHDEMMGLAEIFPRFITRYAPDETYFGKGGSGAVLRNEVEPGTFSVTAVDEKPRQIQEVAATYVKTESNFIGEWSDVPEHDRIYVNIVDIDQAERIDEVRLIVKEPLKYLGFP